MLAIVTKTPVGHIFLVIRWLKYNPNPVETWIVMIGRESRPCDLADFPGDLSVKETVLHVQSYMPGRG